MSKKQKTNEQSFKDLFKDLSTTEVALLRERVLKIMELTRNDINENPKDWENPIIHQSLFISLADKVQKHLNLDK